MESSRPFSGMEAVVLAAGLGERLRPLSLERPKCLFPALNRPLLGVCLEWLAELGVARAVVNTHYLAGQVERWLEGARPPLPVELSFEPKILGTGGGIRQAAKRLSGGGDIVVVNADCVIRGAGLAPMLARHRATGALATLLLQEAGSPQSITVDGEGLITSLRGRPAGARGRAAGFTGLHIVSPKLLEMLPAGASDVIDCYLDCLGRGLPVAGFVSSGHYFRDIGTPASYLALNLDALAGRVGGLPGAGEAAGGSLLAPGVVLGKGCRVGEGVVAAPGVRLGAGCAVERSVLWEGAKVAPGARISGCLVGQGARAEESARDEVIVAAGGAGNG